MKTFIFILLTALSFHPAQQGDDLDGITGALSKGDIAALSAYFDNMVEVTTPSVEGMFNKAKARETVSQFFASHSPQSYRQMHNGESGGSEYVIGNLTTSKGTFRVYLYLKKQGGNYLIKELRFDED